MKRYPILLLGLVVVMAGSAGTFFYHLRYHQRIGPPGVKLIAQPSYDARGNVVATNSVYLPEKVLDYTSIVPPIDDSLLSWLPKDTTYGQRLYSAPDGFKIYMSIILMGTDRTSIHKPEYCLPAQGWNIEKTEYTKINMSRPSAYALPVVKMHSLRQATSPDGTPFPISNVNLFWFVTENQLANRHNQWMWSMMKHVLCTGELQRWAYVMCYANCLPGQEEVVYERLKAMVIAATPEFQLAVGAPANLAARQ